MNLFSSKCRRRALGVGLAALAGVVPVSLLSPIAASAATNGIAVGVFPEFPTRIDVGASNVAASVYVVNGSSGAEATGAVTVTELTLVPSCGNFSPTCAGGADPGVVQISATGTGAAGTSCANKSFAISVIDAATGRVRFTPSDGSALTLGATDIASDLDTCRIRFTISAVRSPSVDSYPSLGEPQTNQVGYMTVRHANGSTGSDQGEDVTTIVGGSTPPPPPPTTTTTVVPPTTTTTRPTTTTTVRPPTTTTTTTTVARPPTTTTVPPSNNNKPTRSWWDSFLSALFGGG